MELTKASSAQDYATGGGWEYPAFLIAASLAQALAGDGAYALRLRFARLGYAP